MKRVLQRVMSRVARGVTVASTVMRSPWSRYVVRALQSLLAVALAMAVFGVCVPFTLLATHVIASHGLADVVYVMAGAAFGFVFGVVVCVRTLRDEAWLPKRYAAFVGALSLIVIAAAVAARYFDAFAHV